MQTRGLKLSERWAPLRYHPGQYAAWTSKARFINLACGRRSGKTELARRKLVLSLAQKKPWAKPIYFYALPTYRQAKRVAWKELLELIPSNWIKNPKNDINQQDMYIRTIFGSELYVVGMDQPQRIEGLGYDGGIIDEACDHKPGSFDLSIRPALADREGWCWRIGVPKRSGIGSSEYKRVFDLGLGPNDLDMESYTWKSSDILTVKEIVIARKSMDPKDFAEQFEASWEQAGGLIFYTFKSDENVYEEICKYDPNLPLYIGQDFNVDPMSWVVGQVHQNHPMFRGQKVLLIFDELSIRNTNTPRSLIELYKRYEFHKGTWKFYPDASSTANKTSASVSDYVHIVNFCREKNLKFTIVNLRKNPRLTNRFAVTNAVICNTDGERRMFIHPRCKHLINDLNYRAYKEDTMEPNDDKRMGHMSDALGYLCWTEFPLTVAKGRSPSILVKSF